MSKRFCGDCGIALATVAHPSEIEGFTSAYRSTTSDLERRQLTVMFCDLVGSTALSARLDPEEFRSVMRAYQACVSQIVPDYNGIIAQYYGDGVLIYFGYPRAHEDDTEQAVRAGLRLVEVVAGLQTDDNTVLEVRIGIATGEVVVGDVVDVGGPHDQTVFGEAPNLAARLQMLAKPSSVIICENTRQLTRRYFEYRDLHPVVLKGFGQPVRASEVLRASGVESRFEAQRHARLTPLIGRDEQMDLLLRNWRQAEQGQGRAVVLTGEPGIGKSHMALAIQARLQHEPHITLRYFCSAHHSNSALFPVIRQFERAARLEPGDSPEEKLGKLEALLGPQSTAAGHEVALVANLLSLPPNERIRLPDWSPQTRKERTFDALLAKVEKSAARQPVVVIFEDVHWIDPTSLELLALTVERVQRIRALLIITARPEFTPPWPSHAHVTTMPLTGLGRREGAALVRQITASRTLPPEIMQHILERTDGVPLFIEELTKIVIESGLLREHDGNYVLDGPLPPLAIPTTLQASLIARLDRLAHVKEVAQIGAAIGREFSYELLSRVAGYSAETLDEALNRLVRSELVSCRGQKPQAMYSFKHALVRDAAYGGLLKSRRVVLHAAIAAALEQQFPEIAQTEPEILAHHLAEAGLPEKAVGHWLQAGRNAARRSANVEAIAHLRRGIEAMAGRQGGMARDRLELDLQFALGPCLIATQGPASSDAVATFGRARDLCDRLGEPPEYVQVPEYLNVMFWLATAGVVRGELSEALEATETSIDLAGARGDLTALLNAIRGRAMVLLFMGRVEEARKELEHFIGKYDASAEEDRRKACQAVGHEPKATGLALMAWALWLLGQVDLATEKMDEALKRADKLRHPHTWAYVKYYASVLHALRGQPELARDYAQRCLALSEEHGFQSWRNLSRAIGGITSRKPSVIVLKEVEAALNHSRGAGYRFGLTVLYALLCEALLPVDHPEAALNVVDAGLSTADGTSERLFEAELNRQKARVLRCRAAPGDETDAETLLVGALATASRQQSRSLELRVANDLAVLWIDQGNGAKAVEVLAPLITGVTDGLDSNDVLAARRTLETLI